MKKYFIQQIIMMIFLLTLVSCAKKPDEPLKTEADTVNQTDAISTTEEMGESVGMQGQEEEINLAEFRRDRGLDAQYIRTYTLGGVQINYPTVVVITSERERSDYYNQHKEYLYLESREPKNSAETVGFLDACERYDDTFWKENDLMLILCWEASGSYRHVVTGIERTGENCWKVDVTRIRPYGETTDEAVWYFMVEIPKGKIKQNELIEVEVEEMEVKRIVHNTDD